MAQNQAAWITAPKATPLTVESAPLHKPGPGEVLIKNAAIAINPVDWKIQDYDVYIKKYPSILGTNVAGTVEEVGEGVTRIQKGQRVLAHCHGLLSGNPAHAGFQLYTLTAEILTAPIPESMRFEEAVVLPLAISTAAAGLYQQDHLALPLPSTNTTPPSTGKTILIWGGSSSVGATAIQLAVSSGLDVVTTASAQNHDFVKSLGASKAIDYKSSSVVDDVVAALRGTDLAGVYDAISEEQSFDAVARILRTLNVTTKIASVLGCENPSEGFEPKFVFALTIINEPHDVVGDAIWRKFVPHALASRQLKPKPDPIVVGHGLGEVQHGLDVQKAGVSARKVVVTL